MEMIVVATMLLVVVLLGVAVKLYDLKRKREDEAIAAQARISDALLMDATLAGLPLTPTAHLPLWKGSPLVVELTAPCPGPSGERRPWTWPGGRWVAADPTFVSRTGSRSARPSVCASRI